MSSRKPLVPLPREERIKRLRGLGYELQETDQGEIIVPSGSTHLELEALSKPMEEQAPEVKPLIPAKAAMILAAIGSFLGLAASAVSGIATLPAWLPFALSLAGGICLFLAGKAIPALKLPGKALVPSKLVPLFSGAATAVAAFAATLSPGTVQGALLLLASALGGIAGLAADQALKK